MQGNIFNWRSISATKKLWSTVASAKPDDSKFESVDAPLEPQTWEGSFLCGLLKNLPHIFLAAAAKQLQKLLKLTKVYHCIVVIHKPQENRLKLWY